jgi:hypothetical protein
MGLDFAAQDLSEAALGGPIQVKDGEFVDSFGRTLSLRGLNVAGASKLPTKPNGLSHLTDGFYEHRTVTFMGRPFPLEEAPLHFRRLQAWGLPLIRLLVTWESIGHAGPDPTTDLDLEYIGYLRALVDLMPEYGLRCFVCAHQDVWSRFSGGSGAPGWTFATGGLDIEAFTDTGAAYVHGQDELRRSQGPPNDKEPSGPFVWPSGYQKLAASTMATLFWAGDALAPKLHCSRRRYSHSGEAPVLETVSVQQLLQDAYIEAFGRLADELSGLEACLGFEPMNEPHRGLVNLHDFHRWNYMTDLHIGHYPSLAQSLALGSGYPQQVDYYVKSWPFPTRVSHRSLVDPKGRSVWLSQGNEQSNESHYGLGQCVWKAHGVWEWDDKAKVARILDKHYFEVDHRPGREGNPIEWYRDCYAPFLHKFSERVSRRANHFFSFIEAIPNEFWPQELYKELSSGENSVTTKKTNRPQNLVHAPHFYDLNVLFTKQHSWMSVNVQGLSRGMFILNALYFGSSGLRKNYRAQLKRIKEQGKHSLGRQVPTIIGEVGIPFDVNGGMSLKTGHYDIQRDLMHALISGMEQNQLGFTLWNYNPGNRIEHGDGWNKEDFSIINGNEPLHNENLRQDYRNKVHEDDILYRGGRVLDVIIRPYAVKIAGKQLGSSWNPRTLRYTLQWQSNAIRTKSERASQTDIFIPSYHYGNHSLSISLSEGDWTYDAALQTLRVYHHSSEKEISHKLVVEIRDLKQHLIHRKATKQQAGVALSITDYLPLGVQMWFEERDFSALIPTLVLIIAVLIAIWAIRIEG